MVLSYAFIMFEIEKGILPDFMWIQSFDSFIAELTRYKWTYVSFDIGYYAMLFLPLLFSTLTVWYGLKVLKSKEDMSKKLRMLVLITTTLSIVSTILIILTNIYII